MCTHTHTFTHMSIHTHTHTGVVIAQGGGLTHGNKAERAPQGVLKFCSGRAALPTALSVQDNPGKAQGRGEGGRSYALGFLLGSVKRHPTKSRDEGFPGSAVVGNLPVNAR